MHSFTIVNFAPIIQFMAGVYLLLLYERFFRRNPLNKQNRRIERVLSDLLLKYQGFFSAEQNQNGQKCLEFKLAWWRHVLGALKTISLISLVHCILLLLSIGYMSENVIGLVYVNAMIILYILVIWMTCHYDNKLVNFLRNWKFVSFYILMCIGLFKYAKFLNDWLIQNIGSLGDLDKDYIYTEMIISCIMGVCFKLIITAYSAYNNDRIIKVVNNCQIYIQVYLQTKNTQIQNDNHVGYAIATFLLTAQKYLPQKERNRLLKLVSFDLKDFFNKIQIYVTGEFDRVTLGELRYRWCQVKKMCKRSNTQRAKMDK